jgi:ABC-type branched-subunit amino acid transport system ATPase component
MTSLLEVEEIHTAYGLSRVLFGISLAIEPGECVSLLGRNGVGKTTTMRSIMGLTPPAPAMSAGRGRTSPAGRRTASPAPVSATSPRIVASSPS